MQWWDAWSLTLIKQYLISFWATLGGREKLPQYPFWPLAGWNTQWLKWNDNFNLQVLLLSEDYGKHLMGVEDLLQKHNMLESDIVVYGEQVTTLNSHAAKYLDPNGPDDSGKKQLPRTHSLIHQLFLTMWWIIILVLDYHNCIWRWIFVLDMHLL